MTYTTVITEMLKISEQHHPPAMIKKRCMMVGIEATLRDFKTIGVRGGRQTGNTTSIVEWAISHPLEVVIVTRNLPNVLDVIKMMTEKIGLDKFNDVYLGSVLAIGNIDGIDRAITKSTRYIFFDGSVDIPNGVMDTYYKKLAATGRQNITTILM